MAKLSDVEVADRLTRRRARVFPMLAVLFLAGQPIYFSRPDTGAVPDHFKISAWLAWAVVLLLALAFAGGHFRGASVRRLMEDETTIANRLQAYAWGFWAAMLTTIGLYFFSMFERLSGREAIHLVLSIGVAAALLRFGLLERRAEQDG
jgi:lipopolysaccharide export LptBFGC system permease protein LptF